MASAVQKQALKIFADYHQFYLWDQQMAPEAPTDWTEVDVARRLKAAPNVVVVSPVRNMTVPVEVEVHQSEPPFRADAWDHIAECSLDLPSGQLQVHECTGGSVASFKLQGGTYRLRAFYGGLASLSADGLEGKDHYRVVLWPAPPRELIVLKAWKEGHVVTARC
jgi:hypothetical protein